MSKPCGTLPKNSKTSWRALAETPVIQEAEGESDPRPSGSRSVVVADAGPLIGLARADGLYLIRSVFDEGG